MFFIKENDNPNFFIKLFNIIKMEGNVIILPLNENSMQKFKAQLIFSFLLSKKSSERKIEKIAKKTKNIIEKNSISKKVIVSKKLKNQITYINYLNQYGLKIQDGKILFEILIPQVVNFIVERVIKRSEINYNKNIKNTDKINKMSNVDKQNIININEIYRKKLNISILVNDVDEYIFENIKILALKYYKVNVVSNHPEKFNMLENKILEKNGVILTTINNKRKSLINSNLIINVDFPSELLNKYLINDEAIIVNIKNNATVKAKRFNGVVINDYEIIFKDCNLLKENVDEKFYYKDIYESKLYKNQNFIEINKNLLRDNVSILYLNTIHGKIC